MDKGNILINNTTRERLKDIGTKRETYDAVINRLLDFYAANVQDARLNTHTTSATN